LCYLYFGSKPFISTSIFIELMTDPSEPPEIPEESLTCDICGQKFDTVESLKEHKLSEGKDAEMKYKGVD
jgi:hypothetical protein